MNPLTNMKNVKKLSEQELHTGPKSSWHDQYRDSAWIFVGGLPYELTEGDTICIFSQYGEIVNINLVRDKDTGKSKGFCFICYEDQRSTDLAVDNFNGIKILKRTIRVDHVAEYKVPKDGKKIDDATKKLHDEGCAPKPVAINLNRVKQEQDEYVRETLADQISSELRLPPRLPIDIVKQEKLDDEVVIEKEKRDKKKDKQKKRKSESSSSNETDSSDEDDEKIKNHPSKERDPAKPFKGSQNEERKYKDRQSRNSSRVYKTSKDEGRTKHKDYLLDRETDEHYRNTSPMDFNERRHSSSREKKKYRFRSESPDGHRSEQKYSNYRKSPEKDTKRSDRKMYKRRD